MNDQTGRPSRIKVWDIGTRLFHWVLVICFSLSAYSAFQDKFGIYADMHRWSGYAVLTLVGWRIVWGIIGSDTARFSHFFRGPKATLEYARVMFNKAPYQWIGHNPLGAVSVVAMLVLLLVQAILGLYATDDMIFSGPLSDTISGDLAGDLTEIHETIGFVLFGLIGLHLLAIIFVAVIKKMNLVAPMITGWKISNDNVADAPKVRSPILALGTFLLVCAGLYYFVFQ